MKFTHKNNFGSIRTLLSGFVGAVIVLGTDQAAIATDLPSFRVGSATLQSSSSADTYFGSSTVHTNGLGSATPDEIAVLARALGAGRETDADYADLVFEYVYSNVDITPLYGLQKGALGAIIDQAGTAFDQAELLVELIREGATQGSYGSLTATYKAGTITLTGAEFDKWLGLNDAKAACQMLADGGIPASVNSASSCTSLTGNVTTVTLSHVWVQVATSSGTYLYDPAYKEHTIVTGLGLADLRSAMGCTVGDCASAVETQLAGTATSISTVSGLKDLDKAALETKLTIYSTNLLTDFKTNHGEKAIEELVGGREVDLASLPVQSTTLPYSSVVERTWIGDIPDQYRTTFNVNVDSINETLYVDEIYGWMTTLVQTTLTGVSGCADKCRRIHLVVDGDIVASSQTAGASGQTLSISVTANHPYAASSGTYMDETLSKVIKYIPDSETSASEVKSAIALVNGWGTVSYGLARRYVKAGDRASRRYPPWDPAEMASSGWSIDPLQSIERARARHAVAGAWQAEFANAMRFDGQLQGYKAQHHHSLGTIFANDNGTDDEASFNVETRISINDDAAGSTPREAASHTLAALAGVLEGGVVRRLSRGTHVTATHAMLDYANDKSHEFYFVGATDYATIKTSLTDYSTARKTLVQDYVDDGYSVLLPRDGKVDCLFGGTAVCLDGAGFIAVKSNGSEIAHMVSFDDGAEVISLKGSQGKGDFEGALSGAIESANLGSGGTTGGADVSVGSQSFPYGFAFQRSYAAGGQAAYHRGTTTGQSTDMGVGWSHNFRSAASFSGDGSSGYGSRSTFEATDTLVALVTLGDFAAQTKTLEHVLASAFVLNWWELEAEANAVQVNFSGGGARYVELADGTWSHGMGTGYELTLTGSRRLDTVAEPYYSYDLVDVTLISLSGETLTFDNTEAGGTTNVWTLRLTDWDFPTGIGVDYTYATGASGARQLTKVQNSLGRSLTFAHHATNGSLTSVTTDDGRAVTYSYTAHTCDAAHLGLLELTDFTDAVSDTTSYHYEDLTDDATCVGVDEVPTPDAYDSSSLNFGMDKVWSAEDTGNPAMTTTYDTLGQAISLKDAANYETHSYLAALGGERLVRSQVKDPLGNTSTTYRSRLEGEAIDAEGKSMLSTFDRLGRMTGQSFPNGSSTSYARMGLDGTYDYDTRGNVITMTVTPKVGSGDTAISRDMSWNTDFPVPDWTEDFEGNRTNYTYDTQGRPLTVTLPDDDANALNNPVTTLTYDMVTGLPETIKNPEDVITETTYDAKANLTQVEFDTAVGGLNYITAIDYDTEGNQTSIDGPVAGTSDTTSFTFDGNRRLTQVDDALSGVAKVTYNGRGQKKKIEQWTGSVWQTVEYTYDVRGLSLLTKDPLTNTTTLAWTERGQVDQATNAEGQITKYTYDALGRNTKVTSGYLTANAIDTVTSVYSATTGQLTSVTDGEGNTTSYAYDGFGRGKTATWANASTSSVTYDDNSRPLTSTTRKGDVITMTYSATGQILTRAADDTLTHVYDIMGRLTSVTSDATAALSNSFAFDAAGRVLTAGRQDGRTLSNTWDAAGNRTKLTHADGYYVDYAYDVLGRMTSVTENGAATALATWSYDPLGRRTDLERRSGADTSYVFDLANRLTDLDHSFVGSVALEHDYGYNAVSQVTSMTLSNEDYVWTPPTNGTESATVNEMNELSVFNSGTITYDGNGNMTSDGSQTYVYNKTNQMIGAFVGASTISYFYDPLGRRVKKDVDGTVTEYLLDGAHEIVEYNGSGTILRRFIYGPGVDEPVAMVEGGATTFYHQNHQGTVVAITDSSGAVTEQYTYDEYGASNDTTLGQPFRYTGRRLDPETGLYYYRARYYSPAMGRFMQVDPIGYAAGMNTHSYVGNDPMNGTDPSGLKGVSLGPFTQVIKDDSTGGVIDEIIVTGERTHYTERYKQLMMQEFMRSVQQASRQQHADAVGGAIQRGWEKRKELMKKIKEDPCGFAEMVFGENGELRNAIDFGFRKGWLPKNGSMWLAYSFDIGFFLAGTYSRLFWTDFKTGNFGWGTNIGGGVGLGASFTSAIGVSYRSAYDGIDGWSIDGSVSGGVWIIGGAIEGDMSLTSINEFVGWFEREELKGAVGGNLGIGTGGRSFGASANLTVARAGITQCS